MTKKNVLGRGLNALIDNSEDLSISRKPSASILDVDIDNIDTNPWQPRSKFDEERLNELATSIKELGIIQPLTLRKIDNGRYQIIAGERRFRASQIAGLTHIPAYIRSAEDETMLELALVENIQREDLDPIEIAISYQRLMDECNLTQENMSERVGKKRSTIANYLRLLKLPAEIQLGLRGNQISMGHARAVINIDEVDTQLKIYKQIVDNDLSVRKVEELVRNLDFVEESKTEDEKNEETQVVENQTKDIQTEEKQVEKQQTKEKISSSDYESLKSQLSDFFHTKIQFSRNLSGQGKITIPFKTDEELEKIVSILDKVKS